MSENKKSIVNLHDLLDYDAGKFVSAEMQLKTSLDEWVFVASALKLKGVLQKYLHYVQQHVQKMEGFFEEEKFASSSPECRVMMAFIEETNRKLSKCSDSGVKDACLLASIQTINHYKISTYGTAAAFAKKLEMDKHAAMFHDAEVNEKQVDDRLSQLAEHEINTMAQSNIKLEN
jgi:ferritin-like metal-binding protein YciE